MRGVPIVLFLLAMAVPCAGFSGGFDYRAMEDARKVAAHLKCDFRTRFDGGPLKNGTAVYNVDRDLAFWVNGESIYAVNDRARKAAPDLAQAPEDLGYDAVYEASSTDDLTREIRPSMIAMKGNDLSAADAQKMEDDLRQRPNDLWARTVLLGYYQISQYTSDETRKLRERHVLWLIQNAPEAPVVGSVQADLDPTLNPAVYEEAARLMREHVAKDPQNPRLLANAAEFFRTNDAVYARECLTKCSEMEPDNPRWHEKLGFLISLNARSAGFLGLSAAPDSGAAKEALAEQERALELTADPGKRTSMLGSMADMAFAAGDLEKARKYAAELLEGGGKEYNWDRGNSIHTGNSILGRIALKEGDLAKAKECLVAAGKCGGSPQLNSFGPDMTLASELLQKGERETVIKYLELCGGFWNKAATEMWIGEIKSGKGVDLNPMLAGMGNVGESLPGLPGLAGLPGSLPFTRTAENWNTPLLTLSMPNDMLKTLDSLYGVPLLLLLAAVLWVRLFSSWQHLWILAPLAFVYAVPLALNHFIPSLSMRLFGLGGGGVQHLVSTYFGSLALLWLLSDLLARVKTWALAPAAIVIMGLAGGLGTVNYPYRYHVVAELITFIVVVTASFALARICCPDRNSHKRFLLLLFVFNVGLMLAAWPPLWIAMQLAFFDAPPIELLLYLPQHLLISLVNGVGLFVFLVPFLLLSTCVPLYREQFRRVMRMGPG